MARSGYSPSSCSSSAKELAQATAFAGGARAGAGASSGASAGADSGESSGVSPAPPAVPRLFAEQNSARAAALSVRNTARAFAPSPAAKVRAKKAFFFEHLQQLF